MCIFLILSNYFDVFYSHNNKLLYILFFCFISLCLISSWKSYVYFCDTCIVAIQTYFTFYLIVPTENLYNLFVK